MLLLDIFIVFVSIFIIVSKFLDCLSTSSEITNPWQERNPLARRLMIRFETKTVIWFIFVLSVVIVGVSLGLLFVAYTTIFYKIAYSTIGIMVSLAQFPVAYTNKTGKINVGTKLLMKRYAKYD